MKRIITVLLVLLSALSLGTATREGEAATFQVTIVGHVALLPGVPTSHCRVQFDGTPFSTACDANGNFEMRTSEGFAYGDLLVNPDAFLVSHGVGAARRFKIALLPGAVVNVGELVLATPGAVSGRVVSPIQGTSSEDYDLAVVGIPALGIYAQLGVGGQFLLNNVPPGDWTVSVSMPHLPLVAQKDAVTTVRNAGLTSGVELGKTIVWNPNF